MTSDAFFSQNNQIFDLIFIDGLHYSHQVLRDINNALRWLSPTGTIVLHDCNPSTEARAQYPQPESEINFPPKTFPNHLKLKFIFSFSILLIFIFKME